MLLSFSVQINSLACAITQNRRQMTTSTTTSRNKLKERKKRVTEKKQHQVKEMKRRFRACVLFYFRIECLCCAANVLQFINDSHAENSLNRFFILCDYFGFGRFDLNLFSLFFAHRYVQHIVWIFKWISKYFCTCKFFFSVLVLCGLQNFDHSNEKTKIRKKNHRQEFFSNWILHIFLSVPKIFM